MGVGQNGRVKLICQYIRQCFRRDAFKANMSKNIVLVCTLKTKILDKTYGFLLAALYGLRAFQHYQNNLNNLFATGNTSIL